MEKLDDITHKSTGSWVQTWLFNSLVVCLQGSFLNPSLLKKKEFSLPDRRYFAGINHFSSLNNYGKNTHFSGRLCLQFKPILGLRVSPPLLYLYFSILDNSTIRLTQPLQLVTLLLEHLKTFRNKRRFFFRKGTET